MRRLGAVHAFGAIVGEFALLAPGAGACVIKSARSLAWFTETSPLGPHPVLSMKELLPEGPRLKTRIPAHRLPSVKASEWVLV